MRRRLLLLAAVLASSPALAQVDLSGEWSNLTHEDINHRQSVEIGDYAGLPINEAGRLKAESWDEAVLATHERQCIPHVVTYAMRGQPGNIRIGKIDDPDTGQIMPPEAARGGAETMYPEYKLKLQGQPAPATPLRPTTTPTVQRGEKIGDIEVLPAGESKEIFSNSEGIELFHPPAANTDG